MLLISIVIYAQFGAVAELLRAVLSLLVSPRLGDNPCRERDRPPLPPNWAQWLVGVHFDAQQLAADKHVIAVL